MHLEDLRPCHDSPTGMPHSHQTSNCLLTQCEHMCVYINNIWANYKVSQDRTKLRGGTGSALSCTTKKLETFFVVQGGMLSVPPRFSNIVLVCILPSACNCVFVCKLRKFTNGKRSHHFAWYLDKSQVLRCGILYAKVLFLVCRNYCFWWSYIMFFLWWHALQCNIFL